MRASLKVPWPLLLLLLLTWSACRSEVPPADEESRAAAGSVAAGEIDLSQIDSALRQQIELLRETLNQESGAGSGDLAGRYGELGNVYQIAELLDAAAEAYGEARRLAPKDGRWSYYHGMVDQSRGDLEAAARSFERVVEIEPGNLAAQLRLAEVQLRLNRLEAAQASFVTAQELDGASAAAHHGLARLASIGGDPRQAVVHLERALELQPEAGSLHYPLAQAYRKLGDEARAQQHLDLRGAREVTFLDPLAQRLSRAKTLTAFSLVAARAGDRERLADGDFLGFAIEQIGEVEAAPTQLAQRLEDGPSSTPASGESTWRARMHYAVGGILARRGADAEAVESFHRAIELAPTLSDARLRMANALARLERFEAAEAQYSLLLNAGSATGELLLKRSTVRVELGRLDEAAADLRRLIAMDPAGGRARLRLGSILRRLDKRAEATRELELAAASDLPPAGKVLAYRQLAELAMTSARPERAVAHFKVIVALEPGRVEPRLDLAGVLARLGRYQEALDQYEGVLAKNSAHPAAFLGLSRALRKLGRYQEAGGHLEAATSRMPDEAELKRELAQLLAACPDDSVRQGPRALALAEELMRTDPSLRNAETLAMALAEVGRFAEAADWQRRLLAEAERLGYDEARRRLSEGLARYQGGQPFRF